MHLCYDLRRVLRCQNNDAAARSPRVPRRPAHRATDPRRRRTLVQNQITGSIPPEIGLLTALTSLRAPPASPTPDAPRDRPSASQEPRRQPDLRPDPDRDRPAHEAEGAASSPRVPRRPAHRATDPRLCRNLYANQIDGPIPPEIGQLTALTSLRVPPASPTPGTARERASASQGPHVQPDRRPDPDRDRPACGAEGAASSLRVPDARRSARPFLGVAGISRTTRSPARSRPRSACST